MQAWALGHCAFYGLQCSFQVQSLRLSVHSLPPFPIGKQGSEPNFCIGWERRCSWSLRLNPIYKRLEISRRGEEGWGRLEPSVRAQVIQSASEMCVMDFFAEKQELLQQLNSVRGVVGKSATIPIRCHFLLHGGIWRTAEFQRSFPCHVTNS
jgi:hypothetical protein